MNLGMVLNKLSEFGIDASELTQFIEPAKAIKQDLINLDEYVDGVDLAIEKNDLESIKVLNGAIKEITSSIAEKVSMIDLDEVESEIAG